MLALVPDLMLSSRVSGMLGAAGHEVTVAPTPPVAADFDFDLIVCDPGSRPRGGGKAACARDRFLPHVDVETRDRGREAGLDLVVPRSRMAGNCRPRGPAAGLKPSPRPSRGRNRAFCRRIFP